jgi:hypothetical protein
MGLVTCPTCFGEGGFDERNCNAMLREHLPDHVADRIPGINDDWMVCPECDGTRLVTAERALDIHAAAVAAVDQLKARMAKPGWSA